MSATDRTLSAASEHLDAVDSEPSRASALRRMLSLFHEADSTIALGALSVGGERRGFTYGDLRALCALAEHARAFTDATSVGDIDLAQRLEREMLADLARLDRGASS